MSLLRILRHLIGVLGIFAVLGGLCGIVVTLVNSAVARPPVEIDPTVEIYTLKTPQPHPDYYHVKHPFFHPNGAVSFNTPAGKRVYIGPAVQWIATQE
jgi:hypothetical protein